MPLLPELLEVGIDTAAEVAGHSGQNFKPLAIQMAAYGLYVNGVEAALEEHPYLALAGAIVGTGVAVFTAPFWVPEVGGTIALTGLSTANSEIVASVVGGWGISGAVEDLFAAAPALENVGSTIGNTFISIVTNPTAHVDIGLPVVGDNYPSDINPFPQDTGPTSAPDQGSVSSLLEYQYLTGTGTSAQADTFLNSSDLSASDAYVLNTAGSLFVDTSSGAFSVSDAASVGYLNTPAFQSAFDDHAVFLQMVSSEADDQELIAPDQSEFTIPTSASSDGYSLPNSFGFPSDVNPPGGAPSDTAPFDDDILPSNSTPTFFEVGTPGYAMPENLSGSAFSSEPDNSSNAASGGVSSDDSFSPQSYAPTSNVPQWLTDTLSTYSTPTDDTGDAGTTTSAATNSDTTTTTNYDDTTPAYTYTAPDYYYSDYGGDWGGGYYGPIVLDVAGLVGQADQGIKITQLSSSDTFFDMTGDGEQNLTAWAGAGNGVLFFDPTRTGQWTQANRPSSPIGTPAPLPTCRRWRTCSIPITTVRSIPAMRISTISS